MTFEEIVNEISAIKAELLRIRALPGENITLAETESGTLINSSVPDSLNESFSALEERLDSLTISGGRGIEIERRPSSYIISLSTVNQTAQSASQSASYNGPFKVVRTGEGSFRINGYNPEKKRFFRNYAILGLGTYEIPESILDNVGSESWIYLEITYSGTQYVFEFKSAYSIPVQTNERYIIPVAYVKSGGVIQILHGIIDGNGRIF